VVASDINAAYVAMAKRSALDARVEKYMTFNTGRFQDAEPPATTGILVTNLPYGERIGSSEGDIVQLYEEVGDTLKQKFSGWQAAILAAAASPYKAIGLKPKRTISLMNGSIPCKLLFFELYTGTRRAPREGA
jgi:23S rRNA G2445 N2-methylase RlmL